MPIETAVWKLGSQLERLAPSALDKENTLEDCIAADPSIIDRDIMIIGRQVATPHGGVIDLLAIDSEGDLAVIELKRGKTPREAVTVAGLRIMGDDNHLRPGSPDVCAVSVALPRQRHDRRFREGLQRQIWCHRA